MLLYINLEYALSCIGTIKKEKRDEVIPSQVKPVNNNLYKKDYMWLFSYERTFARFLDSWLQKYRDHLFGIKGIISESLSNAFVHGNRRETNKKIEVSVFIGTLGLIISIKDQGTGFDIDTLHKKHKKGKRYYTLAGNGTKLMFSSKIFGVFYSKSGNTCNFLYFFNRVIDMVFDEGATKRKIFLENTIKKEIENILSKYEENFNSFLIVNEFKDIVFAFRNVIQDQDILEISFDYIRSSQLFCQSLEIGNPLKITTTTEKQTFIIHILHPNYFSISILKDNITSPAIAGQAITKINSLLHK